jgi:hypothetical protein
MAERWTLLKETIDLIENHGYTYKDVLCVRGDDYRFTWDEFVSLADVEYDSGYGSAQVATDLMVIGKDWYMSRSEYDGAEDWQFHKMPSIKLPSKKPRSLVVDGEMVGWEKLSDIDKGGKYED